MHCLLLLLIPTLITGSESGSAIRSKRQITKLRGKWPGGIVPYAFADSLDAEKKEILLAAMTYISTRTCIKFTPKFDPADSYVLMGSDGYCHTRTGMEDYPGQFLSIGDTCKVLGNAVHEIMHSLGIFHTQTRPDRDQFLEVTIDEELLTEEQAYMAVPFEYGSTMQYRYDSFHPLGSVTPRQPEFLYTMGNRRISFYDMVNINVHYQCSCDKDLSCKNGGYSNPSNCSQCVCPSGFGGVLCDGVPENSTVLTASGTWQNYSTTLSSISGGEDQFFKTQTIVVTAPEDKTIQLEILEMKGFYEDFGCVYNGVEIKYMGDPRIMNPLHCLAANASSVYTGKLNPMPILFYQRNDAPSTFGMRYRYLDVKLSNLKKGTNRYDKYEFYQ